MAVLLALALGSGLVFAISGATPTLISQTRWSGNAAASLTTQGGNISIVNVSGTELTTKWAEYSGNVSGTIVLSNDGTHNVYSWTWNPTTAAGAICVSPGATYNFNSATTSTAGALDTAWAFTPTDADSATNTYTSTCTLNFAQSTVTSTSAAVLQGTSTFKSCAINDGLGTAKADYGFCTNLQPTSSGKNYLGSSVNYEVMVPTPQFASSAQTYYFYMELN